MLAMIDVKSTMPQLTSILEEASQPKDPNLYKTGFWGRAQVVHYAMSFLVSWLHCSEDARQALFQSPNFSVWLQRLVSVVVSKSGSKDQQFSCRFWRIRSPRSGGRCVRPYTGCVLEFLRVGTCWRAVWWLRCCRSCCCTWTRPRP